MRIKIILFMCMFSLLNANNIKFVKEIQQGIIYTDKMASTICLNENGKISEIISSRGCGNFYSLSSDKRLIGLKLINESGMEAPAIVDIASGKVELLHDYVFNCGQVTFTNNSSYAYTINDDIFINNKNKIEIINLGYYSNNAPISPDGNFIVYNDGDDQMWLLDLNTKNSQIITNSEGGYYNPIWSKDSKKIVLSSIDGMIKVYNIDDKKMYNLGVGNSPDWSSDSKKIVYIKNEIEDLKILNSDIYSINYDGKNIEKITNTKNTIEVEPHFSEQNDDIIYQKMNENNIYKYSKSKKLGKIKTKHSLFKSGNNVKIKYFKKQSLNNTSTIDLPYVHQVYDTPGSGGYSSCAPTAAIMILAYYNILPKWEIVNNYYGNTNYWGSYVMEKYMFNGNNFTLQSSSGYYGGHGYMWNNGSPNSKMKGYYEKHGMTASQKWYVNWNTTIAEVNKNKPYTMCVWLTGSGHLIITRGKIEGKHSLIFNDPYGNKNTSGYPSYDGAGAIYDWPGYNHGNIQLNDGNTSQMSIPWCIATSFNPIAPADTIVDDLHFNTGFYLKTTSPAKMSYWRDVKGGYNNHYWWTYSDNSSSDVCYAKWSPNLENPGPNEVFVYIPAITNPATKVLYNIHSVCYDSTVVIDQSRSGNHWVSLGEHYFENDGSTYVKLGDKTGIEDEKIVFDAVKWESRDVNYEFSANKTNGNEPFTTNFSANSTYLPKYASWYWEFGDGDTSTAQNPTHIYKKEGNYTVSLKISYGNNSFDTTAINFITVESPIIGDFDLIYPKKDTVIQNSNVLLDWNSKGDNISEYLVYIYETSDFSKITPILADTNYYNMDSLKENTEYFWKVLAITNSNDTLSSTIWYFNVNLENDLPSQFSLISPNNNDVLTFLTPTFEWEKSHDLDINDTISYNLLLKREEDNYISFGITDTTVIELTDSLINNSIYFWKVEANDKYGGKTMSNEYSLVINQFSDYPNACTPLFPLNNTVITDTRFVAFDWSESVDVDPNDELSYYLFCWDENGKYHINKKLKKTEYNEKELPNNKKYYWLVRTEDETNRSVLSDTSSFSIEIPSGVTDNIPKVFSLLQNYPNPFNPITTINYAIPQKEFVTLKIYNINGQLVETLVSEYQIADNYSINYDANNLSSGIYFYQIKAGDFYDCKKLVLMK